jgi:HSP20 family protein
MKSVDPHSLMWAEACELLEQAERLQRQFFKLGRCQGARPRWEPPVDVYEHEREIIILVALPGVSPERIEIQLDSFTLIVNGERSVPTQSEIDRIHRLEIPYGRFERRIELPPGRVELHRRDFVDGCLVLGLRKLD